MANALTPNGFYSLGSLALNLDGEIEKLVKQHGPDAVREATKRLTKKKAGRKQVVDLNLLRDWFERDGDDLLDGLDPFLLRSNYAMAKFFADQEKPHNRAAAHRRMMRKLALRRKTIAHIMAWERAEKIRPFGDYFRACDVLEAFDSKWHDIAQWSADNLRSKIERYISRHGEIDPALTIPQIDEALARPDPPALGRGLAGLLGAYQK